MHKMDGDSLHSLPTDESMYNQNIANVLFKEQKTVNTVFNEMKESLVVVALFVAFQSKAMDDLIFKIYPPASVNHTILLLIKSLTIIFLFYMFKNFRFSRTS